MGTERESHFPLVEKKRKSRNSGFLWATYPRQNYLDLQQRGTSFKAGDGGGCIASEKATGQYMETGCVAGVFPSPVRWPELPLDQKTTEHPIDFTKSLEFFFFVQEAHCIHSHLKNSPCVLVATASCHCLGTAFGIATATTAATAVADMTP